MKSPTELATEFLDNWTGGIPVEPRLVAETHNVAVISDETLQFEDGGPLSGKFSYEDGRPTIRFNPTEVLMRRRFTIAHELGHFALGHDGVFRDPKQNFSLNHYDTREAASNQFAAELLMPAHAVRHFVLERKFREITSLAKEFAVSEVAMQYRLRNLGLLGR